MNEAYEILKDETKRQQYDFESHLNLHHGTVELDVNDIITKDKINNLKIFMADLLPYTSPG